MNDYSNFKIIKPLEPEQKANGNSFKKKYAVIGVIVIIAGIAMGGFLKFRNKPQAEGYEATDTPVATVAPTSSPIPTATPVPDNYAASITNVSGSNPVTITINTTNNRSAVGGVTVNLISDSGVNFSPNSQPTDSSGNATFTATGSAGTHNVKVQIYGATYGSGSNVVFN